MENLNLIDQIYELEAACAAIVAEAKERAAGMEAFAKTEAEKALATAGNEIYEEKKRAAAQRNESSVATLKEESEQAKAGIDAALQTAQARKALAVAALLERTLD